METGTEWWEKVDRKENVENSWWKNGANEVCIKSVKV